MSGDATSAQSRVFRFLALVDSKQSQDFLGLGSSERLRSLIGKKTVAGTDETEDPAEDVSASIDGEEHVKFSDEIVKVNSHGKRQRRIVVITNKALYNVEPKNGSKSTAVFKGKVEPKSVKRRILLQKITGVTASENSADFLLHVSSEKDYWFFSARRSAMLVEIANQLFKLKGLELRLDSCPVEMFSERLSHEATRVSEPDPDKFGASMSFKVSTSDEKSSPVDRRSTGIARKLRQLVSQKKHRYVDDEFDLDLSYITDKIIAMGYPSEDIDLLYRNPYSEVLEFLDLKHKDAYKVYNLCSERSYSPSNFHKRVARYPMDDHNCPPLKLIIEFCKDAEAWLEGGSDRLIAVHCKAGKGRTGLMVCCFLLWSGRFSSSAEALTFFSEKRTSNSRGVTIPSQRRYVEYFEKWLSVCGKSYTAIDRPPSWCITAMRLSPTPSFDSSGGCTPYFQILAVDGFKQFDSRNVSKPKYFKKYSKSAEILVQESTASFRGDVKVVVCDEDSLNMDQEMFHFWINSNFISSDLTDSALSMQFKRGDLDGPHKDKSKRFDAEFYIELDLKRLVGEPEPTKKFTLADLFEEVKKLETELGYERRRNATLQAQIEELLDLNQGLHVDITTMRARSTSSPKDDENHKRKPTLDDPLELHDSADGDESD